MTSDFSAARVHLERAYHYLRGDDQFSRDAADALQQLMDSVVTAECSHRLVPTVTPVLEVSPSQSQSS